MKLPESLLDSPSIRPMTGNAMHLPNATIVTVVAMACVQLVTKEEESFRSHVDDSAADLVRTFEEFVTKEE
jgi:hypothetical protein